MFYVVAFVSVSFYALMGPLGKKASQELSTFTMMSITSFVLFVGSFICSVVIDKQNWTKFELINVNSSLIAYIVANFVGYFTFITALKHIPVMHYEIIYMICPLVAGICAYFLLGEQWDNKYIVSIILVSIGVYIAIK